LLNGAAIELLERDDILDPDRFAGLLRQKRFSILFLTTALFNRLAQIDAALFSSLDTLLFGGEAVDPRWVRAVLKAGPPNRLLHVYGPTECTTYATWYPVHDVADDATTVPIGGPLANTTAHILDPDGNPVPAGIAGELHLGGDGLADGYLAQLELTEERFIDHPILGRLYRTGDLCRWDQDGAIDYLGRTDHQIKLRGFRIELGEIEAALRVLPAVEEAVAVLAGEAEHRRIVAYATGTSLDGTTLRRELQTALPGYMVPSEVMVLDALPLTVTGKLDRKALPVPDMAPAAQTYEAPRTDREIALATIWGGVLGRERIGRNDNFFELGGDSILSIQIVAKARSAGLRLAVRDIFKHQTIAALAPHAASIVLSEEAATKNPVGPAPLTPVQSWFFCWDLADLSHFNQALLLRPNEKISTEELQAATRAIIARHAALRLRFRHGTDSWQQEPAEISGDLPVHEEDLRDLPIEAQADALAERASHWQRSLDLKDGPVTRLVLFELTSGQRLLWCIHHLAVDGVSWRILLGDLDHAFTQIRQGADIFLEPVPASFLDWAHYLQSLAGTPEIAEAVNYWRGWQATPPLPKDDPAGVARWDSTEHVRVSFDQKTTAALLEQAPRAFGTRINDILLTALALALDNWTGRSDWPIALESHGRPERPGAPDLSETVGWFTAIYPVRLDLPDRTDLAACLKAVKEQLRAIPGDGLAYGIERYLTGSQPHDFPEAEIAFNYLGQFEADAGAGFFSVAEEGAGESQCLDGTRPHAIDINGLVSDGALTVSLSYSNQQYQPETMETLAQGFEDALRSLVELCRDEAACGYTASDFPLAPVTQDRLDRLAAQQGRGVAALYPLSPMQQGMAFHSLADEPGGSVYFEQLTWKITNPFRPDAFRAAWRALVERHPILRSALWLEDAEPLQYVRRDATLPWRNLDWRDLETDKQAEALEQLLAEERGAGFDLTRPPLLRCLLVRLEEDVWQFVLGFHHLLLDGWSLPILFRDLMLLYGSRSTDLPAAAPYEHYIAWLQKQDHAAARAHWQQAVADIDAPTPLPGARTTAPDGENTAQPNEKIFTFEPALGQALIETARQRHLTLNTLFNAGWALVLSRTSGERDSVFGVTLSGRDIDLAGIEDMVGLFINTVPMRVSTEDCPVGVWLDALQAQHQDNSRFGFVPLADIQQDSALPPGTALFNSLLVFENYPLDPDLPAGEGMDEGGGAHFSDGRAIDHTNYPLTLIAAAHGDEIRLRVGYDETQFAADDIDRNFAFLSTALRGLIEADADQPLDRIDIVSDAEREALWEAGHARCQLPVTDTLTERFAAQVAQHAARPAVTCAGETLTYAELDARADDIARRLSALGAGPDRLVGLLAERSNDLITGLLGIVKSGAAYLPIDPATPAARVAFMLKDAGAIALVTERALAEDHSAWEGPRLYLDDPAEVDDTSPLCARTPAQPDDMAYVIYTSGSTGQPKGVMVSHANVLRLFDATQPDCHFSADDVWTMFHSVAFDFSVWEIWGALLHGGHLIVVPDEVRRNPAAFHTLLEHESVTVLNQTPSAFRHLIPEAVERGRTLSLRLVIFGGEALELPGLKPWFTLYGDHEPRLVNMYGITETTVHVTWCPLTEADCSSTASLIGNPLRDLELHLLDPRGEPVPVGVAGEIHVGGAGLARGYLNRPELTAERFVERTVGGSAERLYRSGDLARRRSDGSLEYLGRMDKQVKLRGYRIEIGEIEATLSQHPAVRQVTVIAQQEEGRLVAYLVADSEAIQEVRDWAASRLPFYMVPGIFVPIERIPLTRNGKTDHAALPKPEARVAIDPGSTAPVNAVEQSLVEIWRDVLGVGNIGTDDDFFALGGHSLKALQVVARINQAFGRRLPVGLLLKNPTIGALATHISLEGAAAYEPIRPTPAQESYPLSHAQKRFWLEDRLVGDARYNMPAAFELKQQVDADALRRALAQLIDRHEILHTVFVEVDGEPRQKVLEAIDVPLTSVDLGDAEDAEAQTRAIVAEQNRTRFALDQAPLFRITLITRDGGPTVFVLVMHHIIGDGWSMQLFYRELLTLYDAARSGAWSPLPPLEIQYRDYAVLQDGRDRSEDARFWKTQLDGLEEPLRLPHDLAQNVGMARKGERVSLELSEECTEALRALSRAHSTTPANTLLTLFKLFLFQLTQQEDICVGMAVANRGRPELEPLLGAFVNLLPLRTQVSADQDFDALLDQVTETSTAALDHQDYPYDLMLSGRNTGPGRDPVNVIYAYQNAADVNARGGKPSGAPDGADGADGPTARELDLAFPFAKVDLMLLAAEHGARFELTLEYDAGLFSAEAAERYLQTLNRFAEAVAADTALERRVGGRT
uniref:non-ribosomal peptide synthetase n=1 Tax=Nisaea denitrificans TaxID=390877 RepID=UPI000491E175